MKKKSHQMRQFIFTIIIVGITATILPAQVAINIDGSNPNISAMLDIKSSDKGLLIPRLSTSKRITLATNAVAGLMVYDTDLGKFFFFNGATWHEGSLGGLWSQNLTETYLTNLSGNVGIGTNNPSYKLDINLVSGSSFMRVKSATGFAGLIIDKGSIAQKAYIIYRNDGVGKWYAGLISDDNYAISTSFDTPDGKFYIESTGNIGIGTTTPARTLEVNGAEQTARLSSITNAAYLEFVGTDATDWAIGTKIGSMRMISSTDGFATSTDRYFFGTNYFHPYSNNARTLGIGAYRWSNLFSYDGDFLDDVTIGDVLTVSGDASVSGNVGIGITTPARTFEVRGPFQTARISTTYGGSTLEFVSTTQNDWAVGIWNGSFILLNSTNDFATKTDEYYFTTTSIYPWVSNTKSLGTSSKQWSDVYSVDGFFSGNVGIGTTALATGYKLSVDGKIMCEELRVDMSPWADYVFAEDYKLMSLQDLDAFIKTNGHLPNIPTAEEIQESGLEIGEMQRLMMEKIEELSLYIIQQQKEIEELKGQFNKSQK